MVAFVRRMSKSKVGTIVLALFVLAIVASFALADISNVVPGGGASANQVARVGSQQVTDRDLTRAMEQRLSQVRQENPEADYASIAGDFEAVLNELITERALQAFAEKHGFTLSKRIVDAEIASIPAARDLSGRFSDQAYRSWLQQQRLTDAEVRRMLSASLLQRLILAPIAANARVPVGIARPYASMLLEQRQGQVAFVPIARFTAGLNPSEEDVRRYYSENAARYTVPEQRVLRIARIGPEQVANVTATEQEIAAYYQANQAQYAPSETRVISQAVVADQATAQQIAQRARGGTAFAAAAAPAGLSAADVSVGPQTREQFSRLAGAQVAQAAFGAQEGAIVGPVQSDLGWHVVKIDEVRSQGGRPLSAVRGEIAERLTAEKRQNALTDLVTRVEDAIAEGANFAEAAAQANLQVTETPPVTAAGRSRTNPDFQVPQQLAPALEAGFQLSPEDEPVVETLPDNAGYAMVAPSRVIPAAPAPLESIREQVASDWVNARASDRARQVASAIATRAAQAPLPQAVQAADVQLPPVETLTARRMQLAQFQGQVPPPVAMLFSLGEGKARMVGGGQGEGFYVVKVNEIVPGNALSQPGLIAQTQQQLRDAFSQEYGRQALSAILNEIGVERNQKAIADAKQRITGVN